MAGQMRECGEEMPFAPHLLRIRESLGQSRLSQTSHLLEALTHAKRHTQTSHEPHFISLTL